MPKDLASIEIDSERAAAFRRLARGCAWAVIAIAVIVIIGWIGGVRALVTVSPSLPSMKLNTAVCLLLQGGALWLLSSGRRHRLASLVATAAAISIGGSIWIEPLTGIRLGLDEILISDVAAPGDGSIPGRMSPATAFNFMLLGCALLLADGGPRGQRIGQLAALVAFGVGWVRLLAYVFGGSVLYGASLRSTMAVHTAIAFLLLAVGTVSARPEAGWMRLLSAPGAGGQTARTLLPSVACTPFVLAILAILGERSGVYDERYRLAILVTLLTAALAILVWLSARNAEEADEERREALRRARANEARFRTLSAASPVGVYETDRDGGCVYVNRRWSEITGVSAEAAYGDGWTHAIHPDDREAVLAAWKEAARRGTEFSREFRFCRADGGVRWVHGRAAPVHDEAGRLAGHVGTNDDVTERRRLDEELREREAQMRLLADHATDLISRHRLDGTVLYASPSAERLLGYDLTDLIGRRNLDDVHPEDRPHVLEVLAAAERGEAPETVTYRVARADGSFVMLESSLALVRTEDGRPVEIVAVSRDVTERAAAERMRDDMVAMLSHDLKNPLAVVGSYLELVEEDPNEAVLLDALPRMRASIDTALRLASNFVDASRIDGGFLKLRPRETSPNPVVAEVVQRFASLARLRGVELTCELGELPPARIDARLLERALENLISNAIQFSPRGGVVRVLTTAHGDAILLEVHDQGPGIPEAERAALFGRFRTGSSTRRDSTGLGLFIVRSIAEAHGGAASYEAAPGGGSIFRVTLPAEDEHGPDVGAERGRGLQAAIDFR